MEVFFPIPNREVNLEFELELGEPVVVVVIDDPDGKEEVGGPLAGGGCLDRGGFEFCE